jgi:hypothetical protein
LYLCIKMWIHGVCGVRAMSVLCNIGCNVMRKLLKFIFLRNNRIYAIVCGINHHCELQIPALNEGKQIYRVSTLDAHLSEWSNMSTCRLLFQWANNIKIQLIVLV